MKSLENHSKIRLKTHPGASRPSGQVVTLTGNPLKALRQSLLAKGWAAVAQHLRNFGNSEAGKC